jgi:secreted Zn-dependent insulinase-like peptidase
VRSCVADPKSELNRFGTGNLKSLPLTKELQ